MIHSVDNDSFPDLNVRDGGYIYCSDCHLIAGVSRAQEVMWCPYCGGRGEPEWSAPVLIEGRDAPGWEEATE